MSEDPNKPEGTSPVTPMSAAERARRLWELARLFLMLGTTAFGGPAAHVALFEEEVVRRRRWMTEGEFLELMGAVNFIPGPNSTEMAIHIGLMRAGWRGLIVAGVCFILPAVLIVTAIAWAYVRFSGLPAMTGILYGVQPVVIVIVGQALWRLGKSTVKTLWVAALLAGAGAANFLGVNELVVLAAAGVMVAAGRRIARATAGLRRLPAVADPVSVVALAAGGAVTATTTGAATAAGTAGVAAVSAGVAAAAASPTLGVLLLTFLKIGSVLFGSGYVLLAFLRADFVARLGWMTEDQLMTATAVGQVTPGPLFTTATFIGYTLFAKDGTWMGLAGAGVATAGIFLPAFVFVALSGLVLPRMRRSPAARAFLDGVTIGSLALMAVVLVQLSRAALLTTQGRPDGVAIGIAAGAGVLLWRGVNATWLVAGSAAVGGALTLLGVVR